MNLTGKETIIDYKHIVQQNYTPYNYSHVFEFEDQFIHQNTRKWMSENWKVSFYYIAAYLLFILIGQHLMQSRQGFKLRPLLVVWNWCLAVFSIMGACRTLPEFFHVLGNYGFHHSVCVPSFIEDDKVSGFWTWMFVLSKLPELGDTVFIVLRRQPLIFLHWYHHITVLLYSWFSYTEYTASARWFIVMNYCVHSMMYSYYAFRSMGYSIPKQFQMLITILQLAQMIIGCLVNIYAFNYISDHPHHSCHISMFNIKLSIAMYLSYFVLFARFFYKSYLSGSKGKKGIVKPGEGIRMKSSLEQVDKIDSNSCYGDKMKVH